MTNGVDQKLPKDEEILLNHSWQHFSYHANQRLVTFRFYIIIIAVLIGIYFQSLDAKPIIAVIAAALGLFISLCFLALDRRNVHLVELSEAVLIRLQKNIAKLTNIDSAKIIELSNDKSHKPNICGLSVTYGRVLSTIFGVATLLSAIGIGVAAYSQWFSVCKS